MDAASQDSEKRPVPINCLKCVHFKVSWDPSMPYSCEIFEIKSRFMPSLEVFRSTGSNCPSFHMKGTGSQKTGSRGLGYI